ncbi:MAG: FAD:protein FMN transferase [Tannerella sp.]|jgi:thiamine biosynthesis lipoprotein|nr:FAD:protein FMN transferase [Tannerella sp.]
MSYVNYYPQRGFLHASVASLMGTRLDALLFGGGSGSVSDLGFGSDLGYSAGSGFRLDEKALVSLWNSCENELRRIEKMLNRFDSESETSLLNTEASLRTVEVSDAMWEVMTDCRRYNMLTDSYFDVALGSFKYIVFCEESHGIFFDDSSLKLDFGGYGKGYALKRLQMMLTDAGITRGLVNFGNSSTLAIGAHPYGDCWKVSVDDPLKSDVVLATFDLCDSSLSVSGNTPSRPLHIINPQTGQPVSGDTMVAIEAPDPLDAEVLTTAWVAFRGDEHLPTWFMNFKIKTQRIIK